MRRMSLPVPSRGRCGYPCQAGSGVGKEERRPLKGVDGSSLRRDFPGLIVGRQVLVLQKGRIEVTVDNEGSHGR